MAYRYPQQTYALYPTPHWPEDIKPAVSEDDHDDRSLESSNSADLTGVSNSRRHSMVKVEDDYTVGQMWHDRPHSQMAQMRHYSHPSVPTINTAHPSSRGHEHNYTGYGPAQPWPMSANSESNTPTPLYGPVQDPIPVQYTSTAAPFPFHSQEPPSAISMSPQSSQGGWTSTNSSDGAEHRVGNRSPYARPMSPMTVLRSDGIRKKNARFEIPKERNLANIDALIMQSTDEQEKKELKQQKRLLRNRQAALDSRQRKKTHTEKLEQEKKMYSTQKQDLEEVITGLESQMALEREQWMQQRQQYEAMFQDLQYERDEAIRTNTLETGELRRQNNVLKDCVRELERQHATRGFHPTDTTEGFNNDFSSFGNLDLEDNNWDDFSLVTNEDLEMRGEDTPQRQLTPRPPPPTTDLKTSMQETSISMNTFYMCLLFGAFFASSLIDKDPKTSSSSNDALATLPDDYRAEAGNVLKVLASSRDTAVDILSPQPSSSLPATISGQELSRITNQHQPSSTSLDSLVHHLTSPTRQQSAAAAFSLSAESFNHITNPEGILDSPSPSDGAAAEVERQPTRVESIFRAMQESRDAIDRVTGMGSKARERSVVLDRVPEKVWRDFREFREIVERVTEGEKEQ